MAEANDMILPLLREMRAEMAAGFSKVDSRLDAFEQRLIKFGVTLETFRQALGADSFMGKLVTSDFEERIEVLEPKVRELETHK
jgi:hypothetical protein